MNHEYIMLLRCTEKKYANEFIRKGNIRFGRPIEWIEYFKINGAGRGDLFEGTYAIVNKHSNDNIKVKNLRRDSQEFINGKRIYYSSESVKQKRVLCLYGVDLSKFYTNAGIPGGQYPTYKLERNYFTDFFKISEKEYEKIDDDEKPVLLMIKNINVFFERVIQKLISMGFVRDDIVIRPVEYIDFCKNFICSEEPDELFIKDKSFSTQSEIRIVINSKNSDAIRLLDMQNGIIDIDCDMGDISDVLDYYFKDMYMQINHNQFLYSLPKEIVHPIEELDEKQLVGIILQILANELPQKSFNSFEEMKDFIVPLSKNLIKFDLNFDCDKKAFYRISTGERVPYSLSI